MNGGVSIASLIDHQSLCMEKGETPMLRRKDTGEIGTLIRVETVGRRGAFMYDVSGHHKNLGFFIPEQDFGHWGVHAHEKGPGARIGAGKPSEGL